MKTRRLVALSLAACLALIVTPLTATASHARPLCSGVTNFQLTKGYADIPTSADKNYNRDCYLASSGRYSKSVKTLQYHLKHGEQHWNVDIDGYYGGITAQAVRAVQRKYGKSIDGEYGPATGRAMTWYGGYWRYGNWR